MSRKVLVVDDEPIFCEVLNRFLTGKGYSVTGTVDGNAAGLKSSPAFTEVGWNFIEVDPHLYELMVGNRTFGHEDA